MNMGKSLNAAGCKSIAQACETYSVKVGGAGVVYPHKDMAECGITFPVGTIQIGNPGTPSATVWLGPDLLYQAPNNMVAIPEDMRKLLTTVAVRDPKDVEIETLQEAVKELSKRPTVEAWKALCSEMAELRAKADHNTSIPVANKPSVFPLNAIRHSQPKTPWSR